jgi:hypothetical protein
VNGERKEFSCVTFNLKPASPTAHGALHSFIRNFRNHLLQFLCIFNFPSVEPEELRRKRDGARQNARRETVFSVCGMGKRKGKERLEIS